MWTSGTIQVKDHGSNIFVWPDNLHQPAAGTVGNTDLLLVHISNEVKYLD